MPSSVSNLTSWHMAQIISVAAALANETTSITPLMGNTLLASVSNAIDAGLLQDKGEKAVTQLSSVQKFVPTTYTG